MTVAVETPHIELAWTGVETSFAAGFSAAAVTDVTVNYKDAADAVTTLLRNIHFSVSIDAAGAVTIIPVSLPTAPGTVIIERDTPAEQAVDFENLLVFDNDTHELLHNGHVRRAAEAAYQLTRRLSLNDGGDYYDADDKIIKNADEAVDDDDVPTLGQVTDLIQAISTGPAGPSGNNLFTSLTETIKTGDYTVTTGDRGGFLLANKATAIAFAMPAIATLATYVYFFGNIGLGPLTIDPNGAEVVDAMQGGVATTLVLDKGDTAMLVGNGTLWRAFVTRAEGRREVETSIVAAGTTDIGALATEAVTVTGNTGITSFGAVARKLRIVRFTGIPVLTHSAALSLLTSADRTVVAGAIGVYRSDASGNWRELAFSQGDGSAEWIAFRAEPTSKIFRNGAGDIRANVLGVNVQKMGNTFVESVLEHRMSGEISHGGYNAPAILAASQNDYALPADVSIVELTSSNDISITGFVAPARRRRVLLINGNAAGGKIITIPQSSASSSAANRVLSSADADITLYPGMSCELIYSLAAARWRITRAPEIAVAANVWAAKAGKLIDAKALADSKALVALAFGATVTPDFSLGKNFELGITNAITSNFAFANAINLIQGQEGVIRIKQGATARVITFGTGWVFPGGVKPVLTTTVSRFDDLFYTVVDAATPLISSSLAKDVR